MADVHPGVFNRRKLGGPRRGGDPVFRRRLSAEIRGRTGAGPHRIPAGRGRAGRHGAARPRLALAGKPERLRRHAPGRGRRRFVPDVVHGGPAVRPDSAGADLLPDGGAGRAFRRAGGAPRRASPGRFRSVGRLSGPGAGLHRAGQPCGAVHLLHAAERRDSSGGLVPLLAGAESHRLLFHLRRGHGLGIAILPFGSLRHGPALSPPFLPVLRRHFRPFRPPASGETSGHGGRNAGFRPAHRGVRVAGSAGCPF